MKFKACFKVVIFFVFLLSITSHIKGQHANISKFDGRIGNHEVYVELTNNNGVIIGWYIYPNKSTKLRLEGVIKEDAIIELFEYNYKAKQTGYFKGKVLDDNSIVGSWTNPKGNKNLEFSLGLNNKNPLIVEKIIDSKDEKAVEDSNKIDFINKYLIGSIIAFFMLIFVTFFLIGKRKSNIIVQYNKETIDSDNESLNLEYKKVIGDTFEKYIISLLMKNSSYFEILDCTSDKSFDGIHVKSNTNPDFLVPLDTFILPVEDT
jgi:hypothetical protein